MNVRTGFFLRVTVFFALFSAMAAMAAAPAPGENASPGQRNPQTHTNSIGMDFVRIPAGSFTRTFTTKNEAGEEQKKESRVVITKPFWLGACLVTQEQWAEVMGKNPSSFKGQSNPVDTVSWDDAQEFIKRLNAREQHGRYRLPTEAEWDLAVRGGRDTPFFFLNDPRDWEKAADALDAWAWLKKNSGGSTQPVGQKKPNPYGLYDMYGNAWEWMQDGYAELPADPEIEDYCGKAPDSLRVLRGGCWVCGPEVIQRGNRMHGPADRRNGHIGFRLALSLE